jgi:hypothetical protein
MLALLADAILCEKIITLRHRSTISDQGSVLPGIKMVPPCFQENPISEILQVQKKLKI